MPLLSAYYRPTIAQNRATIGMLSALLSACYRSAIGLLSGCTQSLSHYLGAIVGAPGLTPGASISQKELLRDRASTDGC